MAEGLKIGIVGIGSIGTVFSLLLEAKGYDVEITKKSALGLTIDNRVNLEINGVFGDRSCLIPYMENNQFSSEKDIIFIFTQSWAVQSAYQDVSKYLSPNGVVVVVQNVLNYKELEHILPQNRFVPIVIDFNALRLDENHVEVIKSGAIHVGAITEKSNVYVPLLKTVLASVSETVIEDDMLGFMISRFILSNTISSLCALTGYNLGTTLKNKQAKKLFTGLICEQTEVFTAMGIDVKPYNDIFDYKLFSEKSGAASKFRNTMINRLIKQNGEMISSTLRALENNKRTELDSMCARVVEFAKDVNVPVPFCTAVAEFLQDVEDGKHSIIIDNLNNEVFKKLEI